MTAARIISALVGGAARRPRLVVVVAVVLAVAGAALALRLRPTAATDTFVSGSSPTYKATQSFYRSFGEEPIEVLVKGNLQQLVLSTDIERLVGLEGCLSGNVPAAALAAEGGPNGPCGQLARAHTVKVVFGPGTFVNEAASQINEQLATQTKQAEAQARQAQAVVTREALARGLSSSEAASLGSQASKITIERFQEGLLRAALQYSLTSQPSIDNAKFVSSLVFDSSKPAGTPKQRFAYLFPSPNAALVSVRLKSGLSESARTHTIALIRSAVAMSQWRLQHGGTYLVTGEPVIVADLSHSITRSIELLLIAVLLVMAGTLALIFTGRPRLLPLALALLATALTFAALSIVGASLTMASIAVLPVLVGLSVDYAIQFQTRAEEALDDGEGGGRVGTLRRAATQGGPTIATAAAASAAAILVLALSPVPMVRGFGVLLVIGVAIALLCAFTVGAAALALTREVGAAALALTRDEHLPSLAAGAAGAGSARRRRAGRLPVRVSSAAAGARSLVGEPLAAAWRGARELARVNPLSRAVSHGALVVAVRQPQRVLLVGLALAALGWGLDTQTRVETDITKLVPQSLSSLQNLSTLERATGVGGGIDLMLSGHDVARASTIEWMSAYESAMLKRFGYSATRGCGKARLCPAFSLPDLFQGQALGGTGSPKLSQASVDGLLEAIPPYFSQDVITSDRRQATLAFGIRLMGLDQQHQLIDQMRASLHPPPGVSAQLVGLPVLAAQSGAQVASPWRRLETLLAGLAAVALVLLLAFRGDRRRALAPLAPIALATGWSALILFAVRVPLNPMSVTLGALVIAISTEFSVLLSERFRQERLAGRDTVEALRRCYRRTGAAVAASGVTAIAGFGVLALSDIRMLRDFGIVTLIDLSVSLVGVLVALPAALVIAERGEPAALARGPRAGRVGDALAGLGPASVGKRVGRTTRRAGSGHEPA
ncbi:MAG TPA: MMPL family transporter [Solirubrobacteraceae bacterium]|nr:MMPL family transporter [Solirubrobacteraceae bacterium]